MVFARIERLSSLLQGKGYGSATLETEVAAAVSLLGRIPVTFVDIGGNKGCYTDRVLQRSPHASVHIFEPSTTNLAILREKFSNNKRVSLVGSALGKVQSQGILYADAPGSGLASLSNRRLDHFGIKMEVEERVDIIPFQDYWKSSMHQEPIDLVKIDVEGHEMDVLAGFGSAVQKTSAIQFEFGGCNIDTRTYFQDFWYFFKAENFSVYRITPFGPKKLKKYSESDEKFMTTNFIALNNRSVMS